MVTQTKSLLTLDEFQEPTREFEGSAILIAGPGAGKTRTVAARIEYLREVKGISLSSIKMLTFSRKAAHELLCRLPYLEYGTSVSTIHKFGLDILKSRGFNYKILGEDTNTLYNDPRFKIVKKLLLDSFPEYKKLNEEDLGYKVEESLALIDKYKTSSGEVLSNEIELIYIEYQKYLNSTNQIDFNDILILAIKELEKLPVPIPYLFLDEGHDTNMLQYELLRRIDSEYNWAIFDPYQMIYRWNGADERNYTRFIEDYSPREFKLLNDWRSTPEIVKILEAIYKRGLIAKNTGPSEIKLYEARGQAQIDLAIALAKKWGNSTLILGRLNRTIETLKSQSLEVIEAVDGTLIFKENNGLKGMTIHKSKGLEEETVIVVGCNSRLIPYSRSVDLVEEKNLFYVACSRARRNLFFITDGPPSPFLYEIVRNLGGI